MSDATAWTVLAVCVVLVGALTWANGAGIVDVRLPAAGGSRGGAPSPARRRPVEVLSRALPAVVVVVAGAGAGVAVAALVM